jgi:hypothetical protein
MKRWLTSCAAALSLIALAGGPLVAEVKTREKTQIKFEGMLGRAVGLFGGKAAREGVTSSSAVKGNRMATLNDTTGQIVDLGEEKVYQIDFKKKQYEVTTFAELRQRMKEAQEKAKKDMKREEGRQEEVKSDEPRKEWEVDFDVKETGQHKPLAGYDTRQVIMTVTVREKGKALEEGGGFVMTSDSWFGPEIAALKELGDFQLRYYKQLYGEQSLGLAADQMAMVMAMYPMIKQASERLQKEGEKLKGTILATTTMFEAVKSKEQMAAAAKEGNSGGGGISGMLARKMIKKEEAKARGTIFTMQHEFQEVATSVAGADLDLPAGFKEKK